MMYDAIDYQCSDCSPYSGILDENIKGIELEIKSNNDYDWILEDLIDDDVLICEDNYDARCSRYNMFIEYDGSVDYEIKLQADTNKENLRMINTLNQYGLNPANITNEPGTSCHIHLNRRYLDTRELTQFDIKKASEFMSEILFEISGRTLHDYNSWAKSSLNSDIHADMIQKAKEIDNSDLSSTERYQILNCRPGNTIELRIFSNYYNFNYDIIKLYMEMADHIIDVAEFMKNKKYSDNIDSIVEWTNDWFTKNNTRQVMYRTKNLGSILLSTDDIIQQNNSKIINLLESFRANNFNNKIEEEKEFFRVLRELDRSYNIKYNGIVKLGDIDCLDIIDKIQNNL